MNQTDTDILALVDPDTFWDSVEDGDPFDCWPWIGPLDDKGYGQVVVRVNDRIRGFRAHRVAYLLANDDSLGDYLVCHHCDNPPCCNPRCLFKGTDEDNAWDRVVKRNERKVIAKFREQLLGEYLAGVDGRILSRKYEVSNTYIKLIVQSASRAQLDEARIKRRDFERELIGLPPLNGRTLPVPPALALLAGAFAAHGNPGSLATRRVLAYINREGDDWAPWRLAHALRQECAELGAPVLRTRPGRSESSGGKNWQHYYRAELDAVLSVLA